MWVFWSCAQLRRVQQVVRANEQNNRGAHGVMTCKCVFAGAVTAFSHPPSCPTSCGAFVDRLKQLRPALHCLGPKGSHVPINFGAVQISKLTRLNTFKTFAIATYQTDFAANCVNLNFWCSWRFGLLGK